MQFAVLVSLPFLSVPLITASNWVWGGLGIVICSTRLIALSREEYRNNGIPLKRDTAKKGYRSKGILLILVPVLPSPELIDRLISR